MSVAESNRARAKHNHANVGARSAEYIAWLSMKARCSGSGGLGEKYYAGRGITVCRRWINSFENFYEDMGSRPSPSHSLDRRNNDKGYYPSNCRWATKKQQMRNRKNTAFVILRGIKMPLRDAADAVGIEYQTLRLRIKRGWPHRHLFIPSMRARSK